MTRPSSSTRRRERLTLDALESLVVHLGQLRDDRKAVLLVTDGWPISTPDPQLGARADGPARLPLPPIGGRGRQGGDPIVVTERGVRDVGYTHQARCAADGAALSMLDHRGRLREITGAANRANVSFYPASPRGLSTDVTPPGAGIGLRMQDGELVPTRTRAHENLIPLHFQSVLRELAEETDGYAIVNTNNISGGIRRMMADSSAYYLIGYESTNPVLDGRYRRITVRVNRPGVQVRARPGYVASPIAAPPEVGHPAVPRVLDPVTAALNRVANTNFSTPLRLREAVWVGRRLLAEPSGAFWLVGDLDPRVRREAAWADGGTAITVVRTGAGEEILRTSTDIAPLRQTFTVRVPATGHLVPGDYLVRVEVQGADARERVTESLRVTVPAEAMAIGDARLWRQGPSTGPEPLPTADPRFRRNERLRLDVPVTGGEPATARLLDRSGALLPVPALVSERHDAGETFDWVAVDITLAPLAPGDYVVEVTQGGAQRAVAFRIVP